MDYDFQDSGVELESILIKKYWEVVFAFLFNNFEKKFHPEANVDP